MVACGCETVCIQRLVWALIWKDGSHESEGSSTWQDQLPWSLVKVIDIDLESASVTFSWWTNRSRAQDPIKMSWVPYPNQATLQSHEFAQHAIKVLLEFSTTTSRKSTIAKKFLTPQCYKLIQTFMSAIVDEQQDSDELSEE